MLYYIKRYPFSWMVILAILYLSFFKPPTVDLPSFLYMDKVVHFCMYGGLSGVLWLEHVWNHRRGNEKWRRNFIGATLLPIVFGGLIEVGQEYLTTNRQGDILDFAANVCGVLVATLIGWFVIRPIIREKCK